MQSHRTLPPPNTPLERNANDLVASVATLRSSFGIDSEREDFFEVTAISLGSRMTLMVVAHSRVWCIVALRPHIQALPAAMRQRIQRSLVMSWMSAGGGPLDERDLLVRL